MKAHNIPFSLKDVPVSGNDLMEFGLQGKQIGDTFVEILNKIYSEELPNEREAILNYVKHK
jgi:tRNA nucleotidyltransferase (CCA-adding enzyme)